LGKGTAGRADLVTKNSDGSEWVLKVVEGEYQPESQTQALNQGSMEEVAILSKLRHPNIICYEDSWVEGTTLKILMEYADGGTLESRWQTHCKNEEHIQEDLVMRWAVQLLSAAQYIHRINVLHRDIKLANIMLTKDDDIKLVDFGLARILDTQSFLAHTCCGTPYYISPELCRGDPYDNKADIWALGCVIYELSALHRPFTGSNLHAVVMKICNTQPELSPIRHCSQEAIDLMMSMLNKDHAVRPSADECLQRPFLQKYHAAGGDGRDPDECADASLFQSARYIDVSETDLLQGSERTRLEHAGSFAGNEEDCLSVAEAYVAAEAPPFYQEVFKMLTAKSSDIRITGLETLQKDVLKGAQADERGIRILQSVLYAVWRCSTSKDLVQTISEALKRIRHEGQLAVSVEIPFAGDCKSNPLTPHTEFFVKAHIGVDSSMLAELKKDVQISTTQHRYSDFGTYQSKIQKSLPKGHPPFPPKKLFGSREAAFVEERRCALQEWLQKALAINAVLADDATAKFLGFP